MLTSSYQGHKSMLIVALFLLVNRVDANSCKIPIILNTGEFTDMIAPGQTKHYVYDLGLSMALVFTIIPEHPGDFFALLLEPESRRHCPAIFRPCNKITECPENFQEKELQYMTAGLGDILHRQQISVGVNAPSLVEKGKWYLAVHGKMNSFSGLKKYTIKIREGSSACKHPSQMYLNTGVCRGLIDYPVLDVNALTRDQMSDHVQLSPNDERHWMQSCRASVDEFFCYQQFPPCGHLGIGHLLCKRSCAHVLRACRQNRTEAMADLEYLDKAICASSSSNFTSRFVDENQNKCFLVLGANKYIPSEDFREGFQSDQLWLVWLAFALFLPGSLIYFGYKRFLSKARVQKDTEKTSSTYLQEVEGFEIAEI